MGRHRTSEVIVTRVCAMRKEGATHGEIAKEVGLSESTVCKILHEQGFFGTTSHGRENSTNAAKLNWENGGGGYLLPRKTDTEIMLEIAQWDFRWEYVSGYRNCDSKVTLRCKVCGQTVQQSYVSIRHKKSSKPCLYCEAAEESRMKAAKAAEAEQRRQKKKAEWERVHTHTCKECGTIFTAKGRSVFCSEKCCRRYQNRSSVKRRDRRLSEHGHTRVTWQALYAETNDLTCVSCGKWCDVNDYEVRDDGTIVCGDNYPSIDHIVPVSKGGKDEWDNVQIMCRRCNTRKGWKVIPLLSVERC